MRQGQQNRRGRGRNNSNSNNNRKGGHNPLSRSFESNGPAERIRGTPAHIAEKYLSLARDAQSTGDPVLAENYFQHAEHYNRIIMAYRDQFNQPGEGGMNGGGPRIRVPGENDGFDDGGDDDMAGDDGFQQPTMAVQPRPQETRQPGGEHGRPDRPERPDRQDRPDRPFRRDRDQGRPPRFGDRGGDRGERQGFADRDRQPEARSEARPESRPEPRPESRPESRPEPRPESRPEAPEQVAEAVSEPRRRDRFQQPHEQPEFLRRPVRPVRRVRSAENSESGKNEPPAD